MTSQTRAHTHVRLIKMCYSPLSLQLFLFFIDVIEASLEYSFYLWFRFLFNCGWLFFSVLFFAALCLLCYAQILFVLFYCCFFLRVRCRSCLKINWLDKLKNHASFQPRTKSDSFALAYPTGPSSSLSITYWDLLLFSIPEHPVSTVLFVSYFVLSFCIFFLCNKLLRACLLECMKEYKL